MDFGQTFSEIEASLGAAGIRLAVVGGVALAAYGHARTTLDLDLVTEGGAQERVVALMESLGFQTLRDSKQPETPMAGHGRYRISRATRRRGPQPGARLFREGEPHGAMA